MEFDRVHFNSIPFKSFSLNYIKFSLFLSVLTLWLVYKANFVYIVFCAKKNIVEVDYEKSEIFLLPGLIYKKACIVWPDKLRSTVLYKFLKLF